MWPQNLYNTEECRQTFFKNCQITISKSQSIYSQHLHESDILFIIHIENNKSVFKNIISLQKHPFQKILLKK